jgi:RNA polymerase sigma factor (sigma-70 family)
MTAEAPVLISEAGAFQKLGDADLVSAIGDGYDEAFEVFYARYHADVLSFCRHMLGSREDAEDAAQQTFLAAYRQAHAAAPPRHPRAWLYTVARNRCVTTMRAQRETSSDALEPATEGLAEEVERRHELRELLGDIGRLPEDQRVALLLFELGALEQSEIAEAIGCAPKKVKALVYQARTTLAHRAEARDARCMEIRQQLATLRGGTLNNRALKHHLEICTGCAEYREDVRRQRSRFGLILPVIPLAASHGRVLEALGIANGASHAGVAAHAGGSAHAGLARFAGYATRPRIAALSLLTAGATAGLLIVPGGSERGHRAEPAAPPAQTAAAAAKAATHSAVLAAYHSGRMTQGHTAAHPHPAARRTEGRVPAQQHVSPPNQPPVDGAPPQIVKPHTRQTPAATNPPKSGSPSPPSAKPAPTPPTASTPTPAPPGAPPAGACGPKGQGGGNAWGLCKGPDGLPPPAEEHTQGNGVPGGSNHQPGG